MAGCNSNRFKFRPTNIFSEDNFHRGSTSKPSEKKIGNTGYDQLLQDPDIHAVHINTPIPDHGIQSIKALKAGKHVACTVPMATTVEECEEIVRLTQEKNLTYMMMETVVYAREFLFMKELYEKGELGKIK